MLTPISARVLRVGAQLGGAGTAGLSSAAGTLEMDQPFLKQALRASPSLVSHGGAALIAQLGFPSEVSVERLALRRRLFRRVLR